MICLLTVVEYKKEREYWQIICNVIARGIMKVYVVSLGCSKNLVDTEVMLGKLGDCEIVSAPELAELILINTCSFINDAKEESIEVIWELIDYKNTGSCQYFVVAGCLAQRYAKELKEEIPEIDYLIGTGEYCRLAEILKGPKGIFVDEPRFIHTHEDHRTLATPHYTAWLKVAEGCKRACSFCIIPKLRGRLRSRSVESLVKEARNLVAMGVWELNLIAQDLSQYGMDLRTGENLIGLLRELEKIDELKWIRLLYFYPDELNDDLIDYIASSQKVCKYLDMPVQHFSNNVLKGMKRTITGEEILDKIVRIRNKIPGMILRTSILVGFPGETEDDFSDLLAGIKTAKFDHLGVFGYSPEEGTSAYLLNGRIPADELDERLREVHRVQQEIVKKRSQKYIGKELEVVVEGYHPETELLLMGRHRGQAPEIDGNVIINESERELKVGDLVNVQVSEIVGYDLVGKLL